MHVFFLVIIFSTNVFANSIYQLNYKYRGGPNLIYDCKDLYYVCVTDAGRDKCAEDLALAKEHKKDIYPCVVLKSFPKKEDCLNKNYELLKSEDTKRFCYSDGFHH